MGNGSSLKHFILILVVLFSLNELTCQEHAWVNSVFTLNEQESSQFSDYRITLYHTLYVYIFSFLFFPLNFFTDTCIYLIKYISLAHYFWVHLKEKSSDHI